MNQANNAVTPMSEDDHYYQELARILHTTEDDIRQREKKGDFSLLPAIVEIYRIDLRFARQREDDKMIAFYEEIIPLCETMLQELNIN